MNYRSIIIARVEQMCGLLAYREVCAKGACILVYHGVADYRKNDPLSQYTIDAKSFQAHVRWLHHHREVVHVDQIVNCLKEGRTPDNRWVAITMDDGLISQTRVAADILNKRQTPWTLAVPAGLIDSGRTIWTYELRFLLHRCWTEQSIPLPSPDHGVMGMTTPDQRIDAEKKIRRILFETTSADERQRYLWSLIGVVGETRYRDELEIDGQFVLAGWDELCALSSDSVTICSHGWTHSPQTASLSKEDIRREIIDSHQLLSKKLGYAPRGFAFPHGVVHPASAEIAAAAGYEWCLSTQSGRISSSSELLALPRFAGEYPLSIMRRSLSKSWIKNEH